MPQVVAQKGRKDAYANVAFGIVTMSAANTLTFASISLAVGLFQGIAMLLHRVLWIPTDASLRELVAATDSLSMALTTSNRMTAISDVTDPAMIAYKGIYSIGVAIASVEKPLITDFTTLPGGGKLVGANPIWLAAHTGGAAAASVVRCQLDFTFIELADRDFLELIQAQFPANVV